MSINSIPRRAFLKSVGGGALGLYLTMRAPLFASAHRLDDDRLSKISPIDRSLGPIAPKLWSGDDPNRAHKVLWNKLGYIASLPGGVLPAPSEEVPLVVIGGGMSGLSTAYLLKEHRPIVLEQAPRFGGNSKGQSWNGIDYGIGAAYFIAPEEGSQIDSFVRELGLHKKWRIKTESEASTVFKGQHYSSFWDGQTDPIAKDQFSAIAGYLKSINDEEDGQQFPDIPIEDKSTRAYIEKLDRVSLLQHLREVAKREKLHPHIESSLEYYCWSSFGGSLSEISAASGLNFLAAEFGDVAVLPGGNACAAEMLLQKLSASIPPTNLRAGTLVFDVRVTDSGVQVAYEDSQGKVVVIKAKAVVLSCPKFVAGKILRDIEAERERAIRSLKYRSYIVANVLLDGQPKKEFYDLYLLGEGNLGSQDIRTAAQEKGATDVVLADFAAPNRDHSVLTLYRAFPYEGARGELFIPDAFDRFRKEFEQQIEESILRATGFSLKQVRDIRLARWGHPLPLAATNLIAGGVVDTIQKPFRERVFFVEQDNWALPAFETAVTEALIWSKEIARVLK